MVVRLALAFALAAARSSPQGPNEFGARRGPTAAPPRLVATPRPDTVAPGAVFAIDLVGPAAAATAQVENHAFGFFRAGPTWLRSFAALPLETDPGEAPVLLTVARADGSTEEIEVVLQVPEVEVPETELTVARRFVRVPAEVRRRIRADREAFRRAYDVPFGPPRFAAPFASPRPGARVTSRFGERRVFNGEMQSQHYGLDLDGRTGDPVAAANDGEVRMVRDCYTSGNTIVLAHGAGLFTAYFHLSQALVRPDDAVARGQFIGRVGRTGRATGPHLHFAVRVGPLLADPQTLLSLESSPEAGAVAAAADHDGGVDDGGGGGGGADAP